MKTSVVLLGCFVIVVGVILCFMTADYNWYGVTWTEYPYRDYGILASLAGILVILGGLIMSEKKKQHSVNP